MLKSTIIVLTLVVSGLLTAISPGTSHACSCGGPYWNGGDLDAEVRGTTAIFAGKVLSIEEATEGDPASGYDVVTFEVYAAWKGVSEAEVTVYTNLPDAVWGSCSIDFRVGQSWLVFADQSEDVSLATGPCHLTSTLANADEYLDFLGEPEWGGPIPKQAFQLHEINSAGPETYVVLGGVLLGGVLLSSFALFLHVNRLKK
ncbi:MAG TPA: hypothetical protein VGE45_07380 [Chloroflexia bacterium]